MTRLAADIIRTVADAFNVPVKDMLSPSRYLEHRKPRFAAMKIIREERGISYQRIAKFLGRKDHQTVISGIASAERFLETDPEFAEAYKRAEQHIAC